MPKDLSIISSTIVNSEVNELMKISKIVSKILDMKNQADSVILRSNFNNGKEWDEITITITLDPFTYNYQQRTVLRLVLDGDWKEENQTYYFSPNDTGMLAVVALMLFENSKRILLPENRAWLMNKHVAVSRTINRVDHGSKRIYAQTVVMDLLMNDNPEILAGRTLSQLASKSQEIFDSIMSNQNFHQCACIPQHHFFYMILEDQILGIEDAVYDENRYFNDFRDRLEARDKERLDEINRTWEAVWNGEFPHSPA